MTSVEGSGSPSTLEPGKPGELPDSVDVVVIGAGHNGLVTAGYLAAAGLEVLVVEAAPTPGGNTRTEELTLPGFAHDSCASAHVLIQSNPLLKDDELGLLSTYGLQYVMADPAVVFPQPHGDSLVMHRDLEATQAEVARWSARDAAEFGALIAEWHDGLGAVHGRWSSGLDLGASEAAGRYLALRERSAWDVVHERFTDPTIRSFVLWLAMATIQDPRRPGTGFLPSSLTAGRLSFGWATPLGGSSALPDALVRQVRDHGGQVVCSAAVTTVEVSDDRAVAVRTADGRRVSARRGVVSSAHLALLAEMVEGAAGLDDLARARDTWQPGLSVFAVHAALRGDLAYPSHSGSIAAVAGGLGSADGVAAQLDAFHRGQVDAEDPWLLVVDQTVVDQARAPGGGATFKILTVAPYTRSDGRSWDDAKDEYAAALVDLVRARVVGLGPEDILALRAESPVDVAGHNPHNLGGSCHGGEFRTADGVIAGWPTYRTSVPGLFLTGATTHPGGSVSGRPGRNAARAVLTDLGIDPATVMG
ncbi:MAG: phytoene desaturase family protein, partial [Nocardioidaceae bacterium]